MMRSERLFSTSMNKTSPHILSLISVSRRSMIGVLLMVALLSFEVFNFDTTRYALENLLGDIRFLGLSWAGILSIAFCAIDFAGLARLFTPEQQQNEPNAAWYLMGAWLLGATMNAIMTWWAVSLTLLNHEFGNEILSREQLLYSVPIFIAALVWITRILFIGAFSVAGEYIFDFNRGGRETAVSAPPAQPTQHQPVRQERPAEQPTQIQPPRQPQPSQPPQPRVQRHNPRPLPNRPHPAGAHAQSNSKPPIQEP